MASQTLTNSFMGPSYALQVHPEPRYHGALRLAPSSENAQGLLWTITPVPRRQGKYHISITTHEGRYKNLDLYNDNSGDKTRVCIAEPGFYSGQFWTLIPCDDQRADGEKGGKWFKLSNDWTGPEYFLDTYSGTYEAFMSKGKYSGQRWWIHAPGVLESAAPASRADPAS